MTPEASSQPPRKPLSRRLVAGIVGVAAFLGLGGLLGNELWGWFGTSVIDRERVSLVVVDDPRVYLSGAPNWESFEWVFPETDRGSLSRPPSNVCRDRWPWARRLVGIDALVTRVRVHMTGDGAENVVLEGARVRVNRRLRPPQGVYARCPVGGASMSPRQISVKLDSRNPQVAYQVEGGDPAPPFAFVFPQGQVEREIFDVVGYASRCLCEWYVEFYFRVGDSQESVIRRVPVNGYMRTTGTGSADPAVWRRGRWRSAPL